MNRKILRELSHKAQQFLKVDNADYKQWIFRYTFLELEKDLGPLGDITSTALFPENFRATTEIIAKEDGVMAGMEEAKYFLIEADPCFRKRVKSNFEMRVLKNDGEFFKKGEKLMEVSADVHDLLAIERPLLNLLMRMSGIATFTNKLVESVKDFDLLLCPTRKTLWGLLDKKAVCIGGGGTHRLNLSDAFLVKDTHLKLVGGNFEEILAKVKNSEIEARFLEIEVENENDAVLAAQAMREADIQMIKVIMLDNIGPEKTRSIIEKLKSEGYYDELLFEASGRITEETLLEYAKTGVDIISMGVLTNGVRSLDMSAKIIGGRGGI